MGYRIAIVIHSLGPGGAERAVSSLVDALVARGCSVDVITFTATGRADLFFRVSPAAGFHPLGVARSARSLADAVWANLARARRLRALVRRLDPDVVVSHLVETNVVTLLALSGMRYPVVVAEHTDPFVYRPRWIWNKLRRLAYPFSAAIVVLTRHAAAYFGGLNRRHIAVIPNPVLETFRAIGSQTDAESDAPVTFLCVGRLDRAKRFDRIIRAFAKVHSMGAECRLVIVGDGPEREQLVRLAGKLGVDDATRFTGRVQDTASYYQKAQVFVSASELEGFPVALSEAMVAGLAVVAAEYGPGLRELIEDGVNGMVVGRDDHAALVKAMVTLLNDPVTRRRIGARACDLYERVSLGAVTDKWMAMFAAVIREPRGVRG